MIACHGGPSDHFATYAEALDKQGYDVQIYATGPALKKFQERGVKVNNPFSLENLQTGAEDDLANLIAKSCSQASLVITDVGHPFTIKIQKALAIQAAPVPRLAYYDNPEPFVPGGYSLVAAEVMHEAEGILFANENLAKETIYSKPGKAVDFGDRRRIGIGYYPITQAEKICKRRELEHDKLRSEIFIKNGIEDTGQRVFVYFGGNNEEYYSKAFPAFLSFLQQAAETIDLSHVLFVIQQHPGAKVKEHWENNRLRIILSNFSSDDAQVIADVAFYYQTSMGPQFILAGIPTVQIGHETYADILVKNRLVPTVTTPTQLINVMTNLEKEINEPPKKEAILKELGFRKDWLNLLERTIKEFSMSRKTFSITEYSGIAEREITLHPNSSLYMYSVVDNVLFFRGFLTEELYINSPYTMYLS